MARITKTAFGLGASRHHPCRYVAPALLWGFSSLLVSGPAPAAAASPIVVELVADRDDDDVDGVPDGQEPYLPPAARVDTVPVPPGLYGAAIHPIRGGELLRVIASGKPIPWGATLGPTTALQGLAPGRMTGVVLKGGEQSPIEVNVLGVTMRDGEGRAVEFARDHASIERSPPARIEGGWEGRYEDSDALRVVLEEVDGHDPNSTLSLESVTAKGARLDLLPHPALGKVACAQNLSEAQCEASLPLRFVVDDVDRRHPLVKDRSLKVELGGAIVVRRNGKKLQAIRVGGPRGSSAGPIERLKATIHPIVVRVVPGGAPAVGGTEAGAIAALRSEFALAAAVWGQCGVSFGDIETLDVKVVDPPPAHLISFGDDVGLPAQGGEVAFRVEGRRAVRIVTRPLEAPEEVALDAARAVTAAGYQAVVSRNARIGPGAGGSVDVSVRRRDGAPVPVEPQPGVPLTTDKGLSVRIGFVDLSDGLQHFGDMDSAAGTLEERTLLKAFDDGDPGSVEIFVVPFFAGGGRIGESFIGSDLSSVRNVVLLDRAGIRARKSSLTLAHELGHVLLDLPGHPDDYGVDTPTSLMDSDASDASPFGPRRIGVEECARVVRESGPNGRTPLLTAWPLTPIAYAPLAR